MVRLLGLQSPADHLINWKQAIFATRPSCRLKPVSGIWSLARGTALWTIWIARNDVVFNQENWDNEKIRGMIWRGLSDYARNAWKATLARIQENPQSSTIELSKFDRKWGRQQLSLH